MKKGKQFIDKNKAVKFRLVFRDNEDPNRNDQNKDLRVFQIVDNKENEKNKDYQKNKARYLKEFNSKDMGIFDKKNAIKQQYDEEDMMVDDQISKRDDLWINHIIKKRQQKLKEEDNQEEEEEIVDIEEREVDDEEDYDNDQDYESSEENYQENKQINQITKKVANLDVNQLNNIDIEFQNVKMKKLNEYGLPDTGYDYSQHFAKNNDGELVAEIRANYDIVPDIKMDLDYEEEEMTAEQKEVFDALQNEKEDVIYDELEDDFVQLAKGDQEIIAKIDIKNNNINQNQNYVQNNNIYAELEDIEYQEEDLKDFEGIDQNQPIKLISNKQFDSILDEHIQQIESRKKKVQFNDEVVNQKEIQEQQDEETNQEEQVKERKHIIAEKKYLAKQEKLKQFQDQFGVDQIHTKKHINKLKYEEDVILQNYQENSNDEKQSISFDEEQEEVENIVSRTLQNTQISTNINYVREQKNINKFNKLNKDNKEYEKEQENENKLENSLKDKVKEVFKKRDRQETQEEKQLRKQLIKEFKNERKNKKKQFKEQLEVEQKLNQKVTGKAAAYNLNGLSVHKL